uniref:Uncharacterized protein n=1 Tax=Arundo donax TaxID=35708 RepID=A0A0A9BP69_ARUDO
MSGYSSSYEKGHILKTAKFKHLNGQVHLS